MKRGPISPEYTREKYYYEDPDNKYIKPYSESNTYDWGVEIKQVAHYKISTSGYLNLDRCCNTPYCGGYGCSIGYPIPMVSNLEIPNIVTMLSCADNGWKSLPQLPAGLKHLNCRENELTSLPQLPDGLTYLDCGLNKLTVLPQLPAGLIHLDCACNDLTSLPKLPDTLEVLICDENLSDLAEVPKSLKDIWVVSR